MAQAPHLDYNDLFGVNGLNSRIIISGVYNGPVVGVISQELTFSASNAFNTPLESASQQALSETLMGAQAAAGNIAAKLGYKGGALSKPFTLRTVEQSVKAWTGSDLPVFNVLLKIVAMKETDDVRAAVANLLSSVSPTFQSFGLSANVAPPLNYLPQGMTAQGTITVAIGRWFKAHQQVMMSVTPTFSRETIQSGAPLYCDVAISFTPYRMISVTELMGYIKAPLAPVA